MRQQVLLIAVVIAGGVAPTAQRRGHGRFPARHSAHPRRQLLQVPRSGRRRPQGEVSPRCPRTSPQGRTLRTAGHRAGQTRRQRTHPSNRKHSRKRHDAAARQWARNSRRARRNCCANGSRRGPTIRSTGRLCRRSARRCQRSTTPNGCATPIDAFILARLEHEGLKPSPEASKETLLRRLALDLTGLPPTPEEIDAFLKDDSPKAYDKVVDRLLASPHYGERWGRHWLDAARYADSDGFEKDKPRQVWMYRDWVVNAFNRDLALRPVHHRADCRRPAAQSDAGPTRRHRLPAQLDD